MLAAEPDAAEAFLDRIPAGCDLFVGHDMAYFDLARARFGLPYREICWSAAYLDKVPLSVPAFGGELRLLDRSWAPWLTAHYSHDFGGAAYMERAADRGIIGAFVEGRPAGFVGFHDEGSIGMLEVLPAYRRRGLGEILQRAAINLALERGRFPFGQVIDGNTASLELLCFARVLDTCGAYLKENQAVVVKGRLSVRDEKAPQILCDSVCPLDREAAAPAEQGEAGHVLYLKFPCLDHPSVRHMKLVFQMFPGTDQVKMVMADTRKVYGSHVQIHPALVEEARETLGEANVVVK